MDITWKRASNYREMALQGITCGELRQDLRRSSDCWTLKCHKNKDISNDQAKEIIWQYLQREFDAYAITFFRPHNCPPEYFYTRFHSNAI